jgi:uncharacterized membrane protein YraQ (UPF0718 family)
MMKIIKEIKEMPGTWRFLIISILILGIVSIIKPSILIPSLIFSWGILKKIVLVFIGVFVLMALTNYFIRPEKLVKYFGHSRSFKGWIAAVVTGVISTGPIYMWYPLLAELKDKGVKSGFIATFLYNRAVKLPLLPVMIVYFGFKFVIVLTFVMIFISVLEGLIMNKIIGVKA